MSADSGGHWTDISSNLPNKYIEGIYADAGYIIVGTWAGAFISTNIGLSWGPFSEGLMRLSVGKFFFKAGEVYAASQFSGIWHRTVPVGAAAVEIANPAPTGFSLAQNYPNPFNPETVIRYSLEQAGHVRLVVLDLLGREIGVLKNEDQALGRHEVRWNAGRLSSGVYFYRLEVNSPSGRYQVTRKMVLLR